MYPPGAVAPSALMYSTRMILGSLAGPIRCSSRANRSEQLFFIVAFESWFPDSQSPLPRVVSAGFYGAGRLF